MFLRKKMLLLPHTPANPQHIIAPDHHIWKKKDFVEEANKEILPQVTKGIKKKKKKTC